VDRAVKHSVGVLWNNISLERPKIVVEKPTIPEVRTSGGRRGVIMTNR